MKISNDVLDVLGNAITNGNTLSLAGQLDRSLYQKANKVIETAGGKWNRKAQCHLFDGDAADAMDQIILTGEITTPQDFGYFPTPARIVAKLIELAELSRGMHVLEPSAGQGAIAIPILRAGAGVDCIELLPENVRKLTGAIATAGYTATVEMIDFLTVAPVQCYDAVVMNPPFARQADIHHVNHAMRFLKPGGVLVSVMSASVMFRTNRLTEDFQRMVFAHNGQIGALPAQAFKESGTMVNTVIARMVA